MLRVEQAKTEFAGTPSAFAACKAIENHFRTIWLKFGSEEIEVGIHERR